MAPDRHSVSVSGQLDALDRRSPKRAARWLATAAAALLAALGMSTTPAFAHAELLSSDPAPGAVLDDSPATVTLEFNEAIEIGLGAVRLFDGSGRSVDIGATEHPDGTRATVRVELGSLANGSYVVDWRVVSTDGHPIQGAYTFQVGQESNLQSGILDDIIGRDHTGRPAGIALAVSRGVVIAALAVVFGGLIVVGFGMIEPSVRVRKVLLGGSIGGAAVGLLQLPLEVGYATGRSLGVVFDGDAWSAALDSRLGTAWMVRALIIGIGGVALTVNFRYRHLSWWRIAAVAGIVGAGIASAYGGHGAAGRWIVVGVLATAAHVAAMAVWLGGLAMFAMELGTAGSASVRRFSNLAFALVVTVVASGVVQSFRQLGSFDALTGTNYGTLLIWKVVLVALIVAVAAVSRRIVHRHRAATTVSLLEPGPGAASERDMEAGLDRPRLRRAVGIEVMIALAIVVVTSMLMASNPSPVTASRPFSTTLLDGDYLASITVEPGRVGHNEMHLYLSSAASSLAQPDDLIVQIDDPSRNLAPIEVVMTRSGAGHFTALNATFPYAANWTLTVSARYNEFDEVGFSTTVPIR